MQNTTQPSWQAAEVKSPLFEQSVPVIAAKDIPYIIPNGNRLQNLNIYLPKTTETSSLIGSQAIKLPRSARESHLPHIHVHVHGGAWRDPFLYATSIEAAVAHAFSSSAEPNPPISAIISINYTLSPFPTHPTAPYDPVKDNHSDPAREALHPTHVHDVLNAFALLRSFGLADSSYILTSHSCGACISFQSILEDPAYWKLSGAPAPPVPAALVGLNGLYDLPNLVYGLGDSHVHLKDVYEDLLGIAFGVDQSMWAAASASRFDLDILKARVKDGKMPRLVMLDQSTEDQLVPLNQTETLEAHLRKVEGLKVVRNYRCTGRHAAPWEEGHMIWESVQDALKILEESE